MHVEIQVQRFRYITAMEGKIQMKNYTEIYLCSLCTVAFVFPPRHYHYTAVYPCSLCTVAFVFPPRHYHYTGIYFLSLITLPCVLPHRYYTAYKIFKFCPDTPIATNLCNVQYISYKKNFVASVLASEYVRFKKKVPDSEFPGNVSHNWQSVLCYTPLIRRHLISGYTERCGK
jgi:hypothetical protein